MILSKLPLEIIHEIIAIAVCDGDLFDVIRLREVNSTCYRTASVRKLTCLGTFESEVTKEFARTRIGTAPTDRTANIPLSFRLRLVRELVKRRKPERTKFAAWVHAVADYLESYSKVEDPTASGLITREGWLEEICQIMAPLEADCQSGKLAFVVTYHYNQTRTKETAFYVAVLKRHTALEIAMIRDGMSAVSSCPYLMVRKEKVPFIRRNALEWACQCGFLDTVQRLLATFNEILVSTYSKWSTALRIVAYRGHMDILELLLDPDLGAVYDYPWIEKALKEALKNQQRGAVARILLDRPDYERTGLRTGLLAVAAGQGQFEMVQEILDSGMDPNIDRTRAFKKAAKAGHVDICRLLLDKQLIESETNNVSRYIAEGGNLEILKLHREDSLSLHSFHNEPEIFTTASRHGHIAMAEYALDEGFDQLHDDPESLHYHALLAAIGGRQLEMVKWLIHRLKIGLDRPDHEISKEGPGSTTPLIMTIDSGSSEVMRYLMELGASPDSPALSTIDFSTAGRKARAARVKTFKEKLNLKFSCKATRRAPQWKVDEAFRKAVYRASGRTEEMSM